MDHNIRENKDTEQHIKETAKRIFFTKGNINAKTQEIADEAGVNRALLHYYFRTREKLFEAVLKEAMDGLYVHIVQIIEGKDTFENKISNVVSQIIDRMIEYPYMETFIISELIRRPENLIIIHQSRNTKGLNHEFAFEIQKYIDEHELPHKRPEHFIANMIAMCAYPAVAKPLLMNMFQYNESQYKKFIQERKQVITKLILGQK